MTSGSKSNYNPTKSNNSSEDEDGVKTYSSKNHSQKFDDTSFNIRSLNLRQLREDEVLRDPKIKVHQVLH